jgi:hypothetical protein
MDPDSSSRRLRMKNSGTCHVAGAKPFAQVLEDLLHQSTGSGRSSGCHKGKVNGNRRESKRRDRSNTVRGDRR